MTLNGVMAVTLRYFTEFGKPSLQNTICGRIYARVYCIFSACTMSSQRKFTFAISSPDEFLVYVLWLQESSRDFRSFYHFVPYLYLSILLAGTTTSSVSGNNKETAYSLFYSRVYS